MPLTGNGLRRMGVIAILGVAVFLVCVDSEAQSASGRVSVEKARELVRAMARPELLDWATRSTSPGLNWVGVDTMNTAALISLMEGDGCTLPEWEALVADAPKSGAIGKSQNKAQTLASVGRVYPEKASDLAKRRVDHFLDAMNEEIQKQDTQYGCPEIAVDCVGRIVNRDWDYEYPLHQKHQYWIEPPYGGERAIEILIPCLGYRNYRVRSSAALWLGTIGGDHPEIAPRVIDALQAALKKEVAGADFSTGPARPETAFRIRWAVENVSRHAAQAEEDKARDAYQPPPEAVRRSDGTYLLGNRVFQDKDSVRIFVESETERHTPQPRGDGTFCVGERLFANEKAARLFIEAEICGEKRDSKNRQDVPKVMDLYAKAIEAQPGSPFNAPLAFDLVNFYGSYFDDEKGIAPDTEKTLYWSRRCAEYSSPNEFLWAQSQIWIVQNSTSAEDRKGVLQTLKSLALWNPDAAELPKWRVREKNAQDEAILLEHSRELVLIAVEMLAERCGSDAIPVLEEIAAARAGTPVGKRASKLLTELREKP